MDRKVYFNNKALPYLLLAPQLAVTAVFFFWPAGQALFMSVLQQDPFGARVVFVGLENFAALIAEPDYLAAMWRTAWFSLAVTLLAMVPALLLAVMADRVARWATFYKTTLIVPYAIAPAVAGVLWLFMFNPAIGSVAWVMKSLGVDWNPTLNGTHAMWLVILASAWKQIAYNFLFFLAGLQSIPRSLLEAASIDGASEARKFWTVVFPLLSPTTFFLLVVNLVYAFFDTFGVVHAVTGGGPAKATEILVYKVYYDGVHALDLGSSSAQSVILMAIVIGLTFVQFRFIERKVHY
ncbi:MAG: sn-glycerol-3-phosphate ABC transporter permease UgpA [Betaproteobacteria bacterium]|jgi:sn-glycerol 3-phosphate transport system permease protein|nr:sn-glycerol-3-phosphate ABC transporter permease UgpA [Burkholderiales bacterium]MCE2644392.1 sn-glycerol-3-phosphate ABC transporter permease UgpA [Burkholderiaceae bacterium]